MLWMLTLLGRLNKNLIHNRIRFFFAGLQVIYFLNLAMENTKRSRHGPAPIRMHCVILNSFTPFTNLLYLHIILHNGSAVYPQYYSDLVCLGGFIALAASCQSVQFRVKQLYDSVFFFFFFYSQAQKSFFCLSVCEPTQEPSHRRKPNAKCDNQTNSKEGVKPW